MLPPVEWICMNAWVDGGAWLCVYIGYYGGGNTATAKTTSAPPPSPSCLMIPNQNRLTLDVAQANRKLSQFRHLPENFLGDQMDTTMLRPQVYLTLEPCWTDLYSAIRGSHVGFSRPLINTAAMWFQCGRKKKMSAGCEVWGMYFLHTSKKNPENGDTLIGLAGRTLFTNSTARYDLRHPDGPITLLVHHRFSLRQPQVRLEKIFAIRQTWHKHHFPQLFDFDTNDVCSARGPTSCTKKKFWKENVVPVVSWHSEFRLNFHSNKFSSLQEQWHLLVKCNLHTVRRNITLPTKHIGQKCFVFMAF